MPDASDRLLLIEQVKQHLQRIYPSIDVPSFAAEILAVFRPPVSNDRPLWTERDCLLITYGDSIIDQGEPPLATLKKFLDDRCHDAITAVHLLPFYPYSSDDGFAVIDYMEVRKDLGDWQDIANMSADYNLMMDLVINHVSSQHEWFRRYCEGDERYENYFIEAGIEDDLTQVVRPRTTPLLRATETADGVKQVWCTFGHDQIDANFANPSVLKEYLEIIAFYLANGAGMLRLDAIGYLWKAPGTSCIHLAQTHEVVKLVRTLCDYFAPGTILVTETNVPNHENLSYFGNRNEAHLIYNFSLAPLLVHSLLTGETEYLQRWMMSMPPAPDDCAYLNFTASHDGIGMRPAEGLLSDHEQLQLVETIREHGGMFSARKAPDGSERIYELNVSLFDALAGGSTAGESQNAMHLDRFLCSQTVMLGVEGIPAIYIHSLLATPNDVELVRDTGRARSINRHRWTYRQLEQLLDDSTSNQAIVMEELLRRVKIRCRQAAFHPNATQFTLQSEEGIFAFWRQSRDRSQSIFAIHNMTDQNRQLGLAQMNLIAGDAWQDLISGIVLEDLTMTVDIKPYQCLWIANSPDVVAT